MDVRKKPNPESEKNWAYKEILKRVETFLLLTWCTVHIGHSILVTGLLHVTPTTKVGELHMP